MSLGSGCSRDGGCLGTGLGALAIAGAWVTVLLVSWDYSVPVIGTHGTMVPRPCDQGDKYGGTQPTAPPALPGFGHHSPPCTGS